MTQRMVGVALLVAACVSAGRVASPVAAQEAPTQVYVQPHLFDGVLYVSTTRELTPRQKLLLKAEFQRAAGTLISLGQPTSDSHACLQEFDWQHQSMVAIDENLNNAASRDKLLADLNGLGAGSCVWLDAGKLWSASAGRQQLDWLKDALLAGLARGLVVWIDWPNLPDALAVAQSSDMGLGLISFAQFLPMSTETDAGTPARAALDRSAASTLHAKVAIELPAENCVRVSRRELVNLSESDGPACRLTWPSTSTYTELARREVQPRRSVDLVAAHRCLKEREQPLFPANQSYKHDLVAGNLVIVGGGGATEEIWQRFVELAGGVDKACIVVLPTAGETAQSDGVESQIMRRLGVKDLHVLTQSSRDEVSKPEFLNSLKKATGVWFGGGRQWRFVDAYWGTPAWAALKQVVERGGVIGGSSAGATIQGDLLVRGSPLGNQIMIEDGYRHGLGLLPGVAIDQHFRQRNRFDDLMAVVNRFPTVTGVGIDESTALVVAAPDKCEVLGKGSVWLSYPNSTERSYIERTTGSQFRLGQ